MAIAELNETKTPGGEQHPSQNYSQVENINCRVFRSSNEIAKHIAACISQLIRKRASESRYCVLGLATGSTPVGVYDELVRMHNEEGLSFRNVVTFNLDEYFPMQPNELQSYVRFMNEHLFDHIDISPENVNIPDGTIAIESVSDYCSNYEQRIVDAGGIDIQLLGIGRTGHIGFNEPGSGKKSRTRLITLDRVTKIDAASDFFGIENVPRRAITMGVGTILDAKQIFLIAFGEHKAPIIARTVEGDISPSIPATFLQGHAGVQLVVDEPAAEKLIRTQSPWLFNAVEWDSARIRKATIWLARKLDKPVLKLTEEDYNENGLQDMLAEKGPAYDINVSVFRSLQQTITGWPGGKPANKKRPGDLSLPHDDIFPKRAVIFSPHPDDDVISMGGTLIRLADQGHEVHVAYQTSGNIAVFDEDAIRFAEFVDEFCSSFGIDSPKVADLESHVDEFLRNKKAGQVDSQEVQTIKGLIRRGEARCAARLCGVPNENLHFMELPFYETGRVKKRPLGTEDIQRTVDLLRKIKPHLIYAAGDLSDPHGTHRICLAAVTEAYKICRDDDWMSTCEFWLYRGAWQEWDPEEIEMAVPLSPREVERKRVAIFKHESQKDRALFPGQDNREFWKRAQDRNRETAQLYDRLGLAEYEAIEGFVRWKESDESVNQVWRLRYGKTETARPIRVFCIGAGHKGPPPESLIQKSDKVLKLKITRLEGLIAATYTPLNDDGNLDLSVVPQMVEHLLASGVGGLYVCGSTGEGMSLSSDERRAVAEAFVQSANRRVPVIVQVGHNSLVEARGLAEHAQEIGADRISATCPSYYKVSDVETLVDCMAEVAGGAADLPFYYYHIPALTESTIDVVEFLRRGGDRIPNLAGLKYTDTKLHEFQQCLELDDGRFDVVWGCDEMLLGALATGSRAAIGSTYNIAAPLYRRIIKAFTDGDFDEARRLKSLAVNMILTLGRFPFHAAMKAVVGMQGFKVGGCRLPQGKLNEADVNQLRNDLESIGFFEWSQQSIEITP